MALFVLFFRQMDDITLDKIVDLEENVMDDLELDETTSTVHPERVSKML